MIKYINLDKALMEHLTKINIVTGQSQYFTNKIVSKIKSIARVKVYILKSIKNFEQYQDSIIILKYPENNIDSKTQKEFISKISGTNNQIFIFSNSPFIINSSSLITQKQREDCYCNKTEFRPTMKVYYLPENKTATKKGEFIIDKLGKNKGRYGYYGKKASLIASKLIANGLDIKENKITQTVKSEQIPYLVICEGQDSGADSHLYNIIFENFHKHPVMFVSSKGSSQAAVSFELLRQMLGNIDADLKICMLRDRDHEFPTDLSIIKYKKNYIGRKVLNKRAIECYLYNSETANLLLSEINLHITDKQKNQMDRLQNQIQKEVENQELGNSYKTRLKEQFHKMIKPYIEKNGLDNLISKKKIPFAVAKLITPQTATYKDLANSIFE